MDFTATVTNLGSLAAAYDVQFHLEDSNGARVVTFPSLPVATLTGGTSVSLSQAWNTGNTLTGAYLLVGTLTDLSGTVLGDATAAFVIRAGTAAHASLRTTTDRAVYHTTATIAVDTLTRNLTRNALLAGTVIEMRVLGPSGTTVSQTTLSVGDLAPGAQREVATTYTLQASPEGRYTIATELRDADGVVLAADQTTFAVVEDLGLTLSGRVDVQQAVIAPGDAQRCTDTVINHGTQNLSAQPMRQLVVRLDDETLVTRTDSTVALAPGAKQTLLRTIDTAGLEAGDYACVLQTQRGGAWHTLDAAVFTVQQAPFQLDADVTLGDRGRVLVLLDGPKTGQSDTCHGVTQVGLATTFTPPLAPDTSVEVEVFDIDGALVDAEDSTLERFTSPVNANAGTMGDLSLSDFTSERLAFILTESDPAKGTLGKAYTWTVTLASTDEAFLLTSGPIHTSCSQPLAVDDGYGDFVIDELMVMTADDSDDPHGPDIAPALEAQQAFLAHLLTQAGWSSTIVTDADSFTQAFRRGGYTTYLVLAEQVKLANQVQKELREAVYRGEGLLVAGDHDQRNHYLAEPLGVKYKGKTSKATGLVLQASNLHPAAQTALLISDKVNKVTVTGATAVGTFQVQGNAQGKKAHDDLIAVAVRDYGTGRAVYMGFDLLAEATFAGADSVFAHLLVHTLEYIQPIVPATITGAVVPVHLTVTGQENPPPVHAVITVPLEAPVVAVETTAGAVDHPTDDELVWAVELADGVREELILWLRLPDVPGPVDVTVVLQLGEGAERTEYDRLSLTLEVEQLPGLLEAFAELDELAMQDNAYHQAQQRLAKADQALAQGDEAKALTELVKTADALIKVGTVEAEEMHAAIAEALRQVPQWLVDSDT